MLKKAKAVVCVVNYWKEPEESASGKGREGIIALNANESRLSGFRFVTQEIQN
jgi:hypothetical protein